jgi:prepilin-type N-terminal cleavage/methylation domain-containing protein
MDARRADGTDRGMTLVELMLASSVLLVCLTALAGLLGGSVTSSRTARVRDEAANLANARIEIARSLAYDRVGLHYANGTWGNPVGDIVTPETVGSFTVTTECSWVRTTAGRAAYKKLVVHVAWQQPIPGEVVVTTMVYGKSDIVMSGDLEVRLRYRENGDPVLNSTVAFAGADGSVRAVVSDGTGAAFFGQVAIGTATLSVTPPAGYLVDTSTISSVTIAADNLSTVIVYVQQPAQSTIHLTDTTGNAVSGATVTVRRGDGTVLPDVVTNASGDAVLAGLLYGDYSATITKTGYHSATAAFTMSTGTPQATVPVTINQIVPAGITVRVTDPNGTPIPSATATVRLDGNTTVLQTGPTGTNGQISFTGFNVGSYNITVDKSGYVTQAQSTYLHDGDQDTLTFQLAPVVTQGSLQITTRDSGGRIQKSTRIIVSGPYPYYNNNLTTDRSGMLLLTSLVPGSYTVKCYSNPAGTATVLVAAGQTAAVDVSQNSGH